MESWVVMARPKCSTCGRAARGLYARHGSAATHIAVRDAAQCRDCDSFLIPAAATAAADAAAAASQPAAVDGALLAVGVATRSRHRRRGADIVRATIPMEALRGEEALT